MNHMDQAPAEPLSPEEETSIEPQAPLEGSTAPKNEKKAKGSLGADVYAWLKTLTFALVAMLLIFTFVCRLVGVDGHSMDPTLNDQDTLLLWSLGYEPQQGDVVVLRKDFADISYPIVKRVIAVGGQTVEIDYSTSTVYVDGVALDEPYILEEMTAPSILASNYGTYWEVPEGCIFVMGDNRNNSSDSRDSRLGCVEVECVLGKVICTILPFRHIGLVT